MKGIIYRRNITESFLHADHGEFYDIDELWIPELKFAVNKEWMGIPSNPEQRYDTKRTDNPKYHYKGNAPVKVKEVEISDEMVMQIKSYIRLQEELSVLELDIRSKAKKM